MSNGSKRVARAKLAREHKKINIVNSMTLEECFEKYIYAKKSEGVTERTLYNKQINFNIVFNYSTFAAQNRQVHLNIIGQTRKPLL